MAGRGPKPKVLSAYELNILRSAASREMAAQALGVTVQTIGKWIHRRNAPPVNSRCTKCGCRTKKGKHKDHSLCGECYWADQRVVCLSCHREFAPPGPKSKCCSPECGQAWQAYRVRKEKGWFDRKPSTCLTCATQFMWKQSSGRVGKYCSRECAFNDPNWRGAAARKKAREDAANHRMKQKAETPCVICGTPVGLSGRSRLCSAVCSQEQGRRKALQSYYEKHPLPPPEAVDKCPNCSVALAPRQRGACGQRPKNFCSRRCARQFSDYAKYWSGLDDDKAKAAIIETASLLRELRRAQHAFNNGRIYTPPQEARNNG